MLKSRNLLTAVAAACLLATSSMSPALAEKKNEFNIAWTIYVGWMPWPYAAETGIVKKWADKYGIKINVTQINDYVESINQYTAGKFDGVTVTNMDALTIPAAGGVDTTAVIVGDYSNGNDGIVLKKGQTLADIKGQKVNLVELSVSHYLLARGLSTVKLSEKDIKTVNTSDADIVAASKSKDTTAIVTWNPQLLEVKSDPGATLVYDSSKIPGEIQDLLVVNTQTLKDNPDFAKALVGIWYETIALMKDTGEKGKAAREAMAKLSGTDLAGFENQLKTTHTSCCPRSSEMVETSKRLVATPDRRSGEYVLWTDTAASLQRLALGLGISALVGLTLGLAIGLLPVAGAGFGTLVAVLSMIPPMAVLPILFIVFGLGELSKVVLIIIGITPMLVRDLSLEVAAMPREQLIKAQTLGASTWQVAIRVVLPQIMPRLIKCLRLMIGPAFLFLISAEAIAADAGLGYRIFLVRRYLAMDVILPYVVWITLLAYLLDLALVLISRRTFPWAYEERADEHAIFP